MVGLHRTKILKSELDSSTYVIGRKSRRREKIDKTAIMILYAANNERT